MSRAEELADILDRVGPAFSKLMKAITGDPEHYLTDVAAELRRLSAVEAELEALKKAISEARPAAFRRAHANTADLMLSRVDWEYMDRSPNYTPGPLEIIEPLYTLKGIK